MRTKDILPIFRVLGLLTIFARYCDAGTGYFDGDSAEYPEGYFPFEESPARVPPKVRRPPYAQADVDCPGVETAGSEAIQSLDNLCGDLNKGYIPRNPFKKTVEGQSYPFELIRNKTLDFFSSTLPVLKEDRNLPKVAKYEDFDVIDRRGHRQTDDSEIIKRTGLRVKRQESEPVVPVQEEDGELEETARFRGRGFCDNSYGVLCTIFNVINGRLMSTLSTLSQLERVENPELLPSTNSANSLNKSPVGEEPLTPCPSAAEYVTPVYAKNYQGVWRYVVQIPYEGYFTQTVEVTKCLRKKCFFMDGSCLASPRWVSLLVAELFYPHARFPSTRPGANVRSFSKRRRTLTPPVEAYDAAAQMSYIPLHVNADAVTAQAATYLPDADGPNSDTVNGNGSADRKKRATGVNAKSDASAAPKAAYCDGVDDIGCFQVRLYYDWFLVPGSCKCWKQDFFTKYGRKRRK